MTKYYNISDMVGRTPVSITGETQGETITFVFSDGTEANFYHDQDCCESVFIDDINGDWADLLNTPLLVAEERVDDSDPRDYDHTTWTFYTFRSLNGSVDVRWRGNSNGYYSESVDFVMRKKQ